MSNLKFSQWCDDACHYIYYPPDRAAVNAELLWHLEDTYEKLSEAGLTHEEAVDAALKAMGSADDVGRLLRRVHKPWLGWLLFATNIIAVIAIVVALWNILVYGSGQNIVTEAKRLMARETTTLETLEESYAAWDSTNYQLATELSWTEDAITCGSYTFEPTGAWLFYDDINDRYRLNFVMEFRSPKFWLGYPEGFHDFLCLEESDGTLHPPYNWPYHLDELSVGGNWGSTAWGTVEVSCQVSGEADWYDIHYAHGEGFTFRLEVTRG